MRNLETAKTKLQFTTASTFRDVGRKTRRIVVVVEPTYLTLNLYKTRGRYSITFDAIYSAAVKLQVAADRREKMAAKKKGGR